MALDKLTAERQAAYRASLPQDSQARKDIPLVRGLLDYFPAALAAVAKVSKAGNDKHNPGEEMHHARGKSMDHADTILRHLVDRGTVDPDDGQRHSAKVAWRALALLQEELEQFEHAPLPRGARESAVVPEAPLETLRVRDTGDGELLTLERRALGWWRPRASHRRGGWYIDDSLIPAIYEPVR